MHKVTVILTDTADITPFTGREHVTPRGKQIEFERVIDHTELPSGALKLVCNPETFLLNADAWMSVRIEAREGATAR